MKSKLLLVAMLACLPWFCFAADSLNKTSNFDHTVITNQFFVAHAPHGYDFPLAVVSGTEKLQFEPINPPIEISKNNSEIWLKTSLLRQGTTAKATILEIPGHLFAFVDIWYKHPGGQIEHDYSGRSYPYAIRELKHASIAFRLPDNNGQPLDIFIRIRGGVPVNFAALLWNEDKWQSFVVAQRIWYGIFFGVILVLVIYNAFFATLLRDKSYFYYVGYILSLSAAVLILSGLLEEYIWTDGLFSINILPVAGFGIFFGVGFVNNFLNIRERYKYTYWVSTVASILAFVVMFLLNLIPGKWTEIMLLGLIMHLFLLVGTFYVVGASLVSYFLGMKQARFLAVSIIFFIAGLVTYFLYTYGLIEYNPYVVHAVELGTLFEGIILSLALIDRINLLSLAKEKAERKSLDTQKYFSRRLLQAQEADREMFSSTMHDSIGHGLLVLKQNLEKIAGKTISATTNCSVSTELIIDQATYCAEILDDVRGISHDLHPHLLKRLGLEAATESTLERAFSNTEIHWYTDIEQLPKSIAKESEITAYRIIQECVNNVLKHADASEIMLSIHLVDQALLISIKDDGVGFEQTPNSENHLGLSTMEERVKLFGGWFTIQSTANLGTHIRFSLPIS